jgi:hypothetical protein
VVQKDPVLKAGMAIQEVLFDQEALGEVHPACAVSSRFLPMTAKKE